MSRLFAALQALARLPEAALAKPWEWNGERGNGLQGRDALYKSLEAEQAALIAAPAPATRAGRISDLGQREWGRLRGLLAGVEPADLDAEPRPGEWPLRRTLGHVLLTERRYLVQTEYALRRGDREPVYQDLALELAPADTAGDAAAWVERLAAARSDSARLAPTPDSALGRPTRWAGFDVDVEFRLHRFAAHLAEHTVQAEKTLAWLGRSPGEALLVVMRISEARGAHELRTPAADLARLDALHLRHAEQLGG